MFENPRSGYSKLNAQNTAHNIANDYEDEDIEMDVDLSYHMNMSYDYDHDDTNNGYGHGPFMNDPMQMQHHNMDTTDISIISSECSESHNKKSKNKKNKYKHSQKNTSVTQTYIDDLMDKNITQRTEYCVVPIYLLFVIITLVTTTLLCFNQVSADLGMSIIIGFTVIGSLIGMYGVYAWGTFSDVIDYLRVRNEQYRENISRLNEMGEVLQNDVDDINVSIEMHKRNSQHLQTQLDAYNGLKKELQHICDECGPHNKADNENENGNEDILDLLNSLTEQCDRLETVIEDNEKANLLSMFYSVRLYDWDKRGLSRKEYDRFLGRVTKKTREKFEKEGGFEMLDPDHNGFIDVDEFAGMLHRVLNICVQESQHLSQSSLRVLRKL